MRGCVVGLNLERASFGGLVAEFITDGDCNSVVAVGQLQVVKVGDRAVGLCDKLILVIVGDIDAVDIHTDGAGINAAGVLVLNVMHVSVNTQGVGGEHGAVFDIGVVYSDRVNNGSVDVVNIGAVNELEVIEVELTCTLSTGHLGAGNEHETKCL